MALQRGSTGDDVKALQEQLIAAGYKLDADGVFGAKTQAAVKDYQTNNGLAVDGIVGSQTTASLAGLSASPQSSSTIGSAAWNNYLDQSDRNDAMDVSPSTPARTTASTALASTSAASSVPKTSPSGSSSSYVAPASTSGNYDRNLDYTSTLKNLMDSGSTDTAQLQSLLTQMQAKEKDPAFSQWANPSFDAEVQGYINALNGNAAAPQAQAQANAQALAQKAENQQSMQALQNKIDEQQQVIEELKNLYLNQNTAALEEQKAAKQAAVDQVVGRLSLQRDNTKTSYADMFRQLYLNRMNNEKNLNQRLAATGQTGGQAESTMLGLATEYENALRQGGVAEQQALSQLDQAMVDAQLTGDISSAEYAADLAQKQTDNYAQVLQNLINRNDTINQQAASLQASQDAANRNYAYQTAMAILQSGSMATDDLLNAAGISKADAATIVATAAAQKKAASTATTSPKKATELQAQLAWNAIQNGQDTAENRAILESYYGMPFETIATAYNFNPNSSSGVSLTNEDKAGYEERSAMYQQVKERAEEIFKKNGKESALAFLKEAYYGDVQILNTIDYNELYKYFRNRDGSNNAQQESEDANPLMKLPTTYK